MVQSEIPWSDIAVTNADGDRSELGRLFSTLTTSLVRAQTVGEVLQRIVDAAVVVIPDVDVASVTLRTPDGHFHTPAYSDPIAEILDQFQYDLGEGPCLTAAELTGTGLAECSDLRSDTRWPRFSAAAANEGVEALLATTLQTTPLVSAEAGALNLYSWRTRPFDDDDRVAALLLATHASLALAHTRAVTLADLQATHLRAAIDSRDVIGQAKGILMSRRHLTAEQAFDLMRRTSQELNIKLAELARTIASRYQDLGLAEELPTQPEHP